MNALAAASSPIVDWGKLGQVVLYSLVAGIGVTICFSLAVVGATRFAEMRRNDQGAGAFGYALLATVGLAATLAAAVIAIVVMTQKS
jgi:cation transporter-like permease